MNIAWNTPRTALLILLALFIAGCAMKPAPAPKISAAEVWRLFAERSVQAQVPTAWMLKASINLSSPERKSRVLARMWGGQDTPVRLEIGSGMGQIYSNVREDGLTRVTHSPQEGTAKIEPAGVRGLPPLGNGVPFTLGQMASLFLGRWLDVLPMTYDRAEPAAEGWKFHLAAGSPASWVIVDARGLPVSVGGSSSGKGDRGWTMSIGDWPDADDKPEPRPDLPRLFNVTSPPATEAVFRLKEIEERSESWQEAALRLNLPSDTDIVIIRPDK